MRVFLVCALLVMLGCGTVDSIGDMLVGPDTAQQEQIVQAKTDLAMKEEEIRETTTNIKRTSENGGDTTDLQAVLAIQHADHSAIQARLDSLQTEARMSTWTDIGEIAIYTVLGLLGVGGGGAAVWKRKRAKRAASVDVVTV